MNFILKNSKIFRKRSVLQMILTEEVILWKYEVIALNAKKYNKS